MAIKGVIFDLDGVVTKTSLIHFKAWKIVIDELIMQIIPEQNAPFTEKEYFHYLDGIPRIDGLRNFLFSRGINYEDIEEFYPSIEICIQYSCDKKNNIFFELLAQDQVECYQDTIDFIDLLLQHNYSIAIISSSKNCRTILKNAHIEHLFPVCIDGLISEKLNLPGKPNPDIFLEAAKYLNLLPEECIVVEDALAGIKAAKEGDFGVVIALDRRNKLYADFLNLEADYILPDLSKNQKLLYHQLFVQKKSPDPAISALPIIDELMKSHHELVIFLDYDGTLTPIVEHPENAILSAAMHDCLIRLSQHYATVIISGRELDNLKKHVAIPGLYYSGNHGFQFEEPGGSFVYSIGNEFKEDIDIVFKRLNEIFGNIKGCIIENKKFSISVHYRMVDENLYDFISYQLDNLLQDYPNLLKTSGKKIFDIRPNIPWNKGTASANILNKFKVHKQNLIPLYIGDDITDEDAFKKFLFKGITIKVTEGFSKSHAHYFLKSPTEVHHFLENLINYKDVRYESLDCQLSQL